MTKRLDDRVEIGPSFGKPSRRAGGDDDLVDEFLHRDGHVQTQRVVVERRTGLESAIMNPDDRAHLSLMLKGLSLVHDRSERIALRNGILVMICVGNHAD